MRCADPESPGIALAPGPGEASRTQTGIHSRPSSSGPTEAPRYAPRPAPVVAPRAARRARSQPDPTNAPIEKKAASPSIEAPTAAPRLAPARRRLDTLTATSMRSMSGQDSRTSRCRTCIPTTSASWYQMSPLTGSASPVQTRASVPGSSLGPCGFASWPATAPGRARPAPTTVASIRTGPIRRGRSSRCTRLPPGSPPRPRRAARAWHALPCAERMPRGDQPGDARPSTARACGLSVPRAGGAAFLRGARGASPP